MRKTNEVDSISLLDTHSAPTMPFPFTIDDKTTSEELRDMVKECENINREFQLELMQQKDEIIGLRNENANITVMLNELLVDYKEKEFEYELIKKRLKLFDKMTGSAPWKIVRSSKQLLSGSKKNRNQ